MAKQGGGDRQREETMVDRETYEPLMPSGSLEEATERNQAEDKIREQAALLDLAYDGIIVRDMEGTIKFWNRGAEEIYGWTRQEAMGKISQVLLQTRFPGSLEETIIGLLRRGRWEGELLHTGRDGKQITVASRWALQRDGKGRPIGILEINNDITERKQPENRIRATNALLSLFAKKPSRKEYLDAVLDLILQWSRCRCGGIRVLNDRRYIPYESYTGFSREFWESENWLSIAQDQCACVRIITGDPDPQDLSMVTSAGSFRCDNTLKFVGSLTEEERGRFRGGCIQNGFLSVAVIPIRYGERILGAIHLADEREGMVPPDTVEFIESMTPLIGEAVNRFNLEEEVRESENRLRLLSSQLLTVQEDERKRFARDLHDSLGASLAAIKYGVEAVLHQVTERRTKAGTTAESLETIIGRIQQTIEEVRRIQMDLRPATLDDLGILPTISWFVREFQKIYSHIRVEKEIDVEESDMPEQLKTVIYRVVQEALNNIAKHSKAERIYLFLAKRADRIELMIEDNGVGFDSERMISVKNEEKGLGLSSMRERTELSGGIFTIDSSIGAGTTIRASWPICK